MVEAKYLLITVAVMSGIAVGSRRPARQASTCSAGSPCTRLSSCQYFKDLLNNPSAEDIREFHSAKCDNNRHNPKLCCPTQSTPTPTQPTPTQPTPTQPTQPTPFSCGGMVSQNKIISGEDAPLGAYPWMAALGYGRVDFPDWACGGALINTRYVLTAAHCVDERFTFGSQVSLVRLGEHNLDTEEDCEEHTLVPGRDCSPPVQDIAPEAIIPHPQFDKRTNVSDDIALIRLERNVVLNSFVQPICLPQAGLDVRTFLGSRQALVAGWGLTETGRHSAVLQRVRLPFVDLDKCRPHFSRKGIQLLKEQVCFGGQGSRDTCRGDSGGGVFAPSGVSGPHTLLGVVSFGVPGLGCGAIDVPAVYTNVASYSNWITSNLRP